ncbi:MAG TPA: VCBS repeat-containing protein, partial [Enhygromyxa sp.]|nr:VCBS repeat-containing protein [Enhygromyxa sp.]
FTPALGDIDGDGLIEIVTAGPFGPLMAFEHDGTLKWMTPTVWDIGAYFGQDLRYSNSAALADLDHDGDVEIVTANMIFDHQGTLLHKLPTIAGQWGATTTADLDDDDDLEIVLGSAVYHHDGSLLWSTNLQPGYPQVADLDDDGLPEVLLTNFNGLSLIEHDGTVTYQDLRPTNVAAGGTNWHRPATIHDFDGDDQPEYAVSSASQYTVYEHDASIMWTANVADLSGIAAGTAFDFLGAGTAQAMYADEQSLFVFDGVGSVLLQVPRSSGTLSEYPVVADIDNDGSAEILVVSNQYNPGPDYQCLRAIRDVEDRWIQARRIWNQHAYHVSNVREDGTIPQYQPKSWEGLNTFRTNAQIEGGGICDPAG